MNDTIISLNHVTKTYKLYKKPSDRFLDIIGLLRDSKQTPLHHALSGVTLDIKRGEKVAIIGRNGAGKSTLLKIITEVVRPTTGTIHISSKASALLQIGSTFHPEFSGRENVLSYFSHLGITGKDAIGKLSEVIEFSELDEYIDQPVKTYSTGMSARLMFAASTMIKPDLLVIDEILSVGDAYFAKKSFEKISELCKGGDTTLLLVSHDIYSSAKLCDRMVWIDGGKVMIDGPSSTVTMAYEDSLRLQEEARIRRSQIRRWGLSKPAKEPSLLIIEISTRNNAPLPNPIFIKSIMIEADDGETQTVSILEERNIDQSQPNNPFLDFSVGVWGENIEYEGCYAREMMDHGSPFNKVVVGFPCISKNFLERSTFKISMNGTADIDLNIRGYYEGKVFLVGNLKTKLKNKWELFEFNIGSNFSTIDQRVLVSEISASGVHGTGVIRISNIQLFNRFNKSVSVIDYSEEFIIRFEIDIRDKNFKEYPQFLLAFQRDGVFDVCRVIERSIFIDASTKNVATVAVKMPQVRLGEGTYFMSIMVAKAGYYDSPQAIFFSINPNVYTCLTKVLEFTVVGRGGVGAGAGVVADSKWIIDEKEVVTD